MLYTCQEVTLNRVSLSAKNVSDNWKQYLEFVSQQFRQQSEIILKIFKSNLITEQYFEVTCTLGNGINHTKPLMYPNQLSNSKGR